MYIIEAEYKGIVPMMMDRYYELLSGEKLPSKKAKVLTEEMIIGICKQKLHSDRKGVFVPADNIRMMLIGNQIRPGAAKILGSYVEKQKGTEYEQMCKSSIWIVGPKDPLKIYINPARKTFDDIDERPFVTKAGKNNVSRKISYRPLIKLPWSLQFIIQVTDDQIDETKVRELLDIAGLRCGCCAYGPTFGRCIISKWKVRK